MEAKFHQLLANWLLQVGLHVFSGVQIFAGTIIEQSKKSTYLPEVLQVLSPDVSM